MLKRYLSPSGNRRLYVNIGWKSFESNGRVIREPINRACMFTPCFETDDEVVQAALESHTLFNVEIFPLSEELNGYKPIHQLAAEAPMVEERQGLINEARALRIIGLNLAEASNQEIREAIDRHKTLLMKKAAAEVPVTPPEVGEMPPVAEARDLSDPPKRRGRKPKNAVEVAV